MDTWNKKTKNLFLSSSSNILSLKARCDQNYRIDKNSLFFAALSVNPTFSRWLIVKVKSFISKIFFFDKTLKIDNSDEDAKHYFGRSDL